tara:strand:- start:1802 stop:4408 length:2607 start_codon:yes stop_codon:yes gene_type:complete
MSSRFIMPFADVGSGIKPSSGARLFFFEPDGVTLKNTFSDQLATPTANTNPVISDSNGVFGNIYLVGSYKVTLQNKNGSQTFGGVSVEEFASINDISLPYVFNTVANMLASTDVFTVRKILTTRINNTFTNTGGADYRVNTLAQERIDRNDGGWVPDGTVSGGVVVGGSHYLEGGTTKVAVIMNRGTLSDSQFGVIGNDDNGIVDDYPALSRFFDEIRTGKALGGRKTGGIRPLITPRSLFYISATLDFIDLRILVNGGQSEVRPTVAGLTIFNLEQTGGGLEDFQLWHDHLDAEQVLTLAKPAIALSGGQPVAITSESTFTKMSRVLTYNAYRNVELDSISPDGGLIWQFIFENVLSWDSLDYGIYLWSVAQTSTTTTLQNCHTKSVFRSSVQHGGKVFRALQHMLSTNIIEPEVTVGWENYWLLGIAPGGGNEVPSTQAAWVSGTFYRTNGKGYLFNNVQTVFMGNCSSDGGSNFTEGNVVSCLNSILTIDTFHLEGTNLNFADRPPFIINSDMNFGSLYLYDLRIQMPNVSDRCALIGGNLSRERTGSLFLVRNQAQNAVKSGDIDYVRLNNGSGQDFSRFSCGIGAPSELVTGKETTRAFTAARDNSRTADLEFVLASTLNYYKIYEVVIPATGAAEATFQEFSDIVEITSNSGNDSVDLLGQYAKVRISAFVQSGTPPDKSQFDLEIVNGNSGYIYQTFNTTTRLLELWVKCKANGQASIANYKGRGNGFDVSTGKQRMLYSAVETLGTTVEGQQGFAEVPVFSASDGFVEIIPAGSYTSGDYNLPSGKTFADITKLKVITKTGDTVSQYEIDTVLIPSQSEAFGYRGGSVFATVFPLGFLSTATALRVSATSAQILYCSAVF